MPVRSRSTRPGSASRRAGEGWLDLGEPAGGQPLVARRFGPVQCCFVRLLHGSDHDSVKACIFIMPMVFLLVACGGGGDARNGDSHQDRGMGGSSMPANPLPERDPPRRIRLLGSPRHESVSSGRPASEPASSGRPASGPAAGRESGFRDLGFLGGFVPGPIPGGGDHANRQRLDLVGARNAHRPG